MRYVYICEIFSCYSGLPVSLRIMHFFLQPNKHLGFKRTTKLHILHSTHLCQHVVPRTIHRTATGAGNATSRRIPLPQTNGRGTEGRGQASRKTTSASRARWTRKGHPALQEAMVCSQSATKEGQDNNLLVAMK